MKSRYVWILPFILTLYVLYSYNYQKTIGMKLHFLHGNILSEFFAIKSFFFSQNEVNEIKQKPNNNNNNQQQQQKIFTKNELIKYSNLKDGLYLAILGQVYDVTKGEKHYGAEGSYHAFVGKDASLAFITGDFTDEGLTDDVSSLTSQQIKSLFNWRDFYAKDYIFKGILVGRYYDINGAPTKAYEAVQEKLSLAEKEKSDEEEKKRVFPPCNIEWKPDVGTRVWCTKKSGGIERDWVGVPRMLYETGSDQQRCACINVKSKEYELHKGNLREYEGCAKGSTNCVVKTN